MNITFDYEEAIYTIEEEIAKIPRTIKDSTKPIMNKAAKIVKTNVETSLKNLHESEAITNYDGTTPYIHMKDDVKTSVKDDKEGSIIAIIRGGKYTGYKWHLVNNGHFDRKNNFVSATHFIDTALKQSESDVDTIVDQLISKAVQ